MTPGQLARRVLGPLFPLAARVYRRAAVDLAAVAVTMPRVPSGGHILDIGGGDGALMNHLLPLNPGVRATIIDLAPAVGGFLSPDVSERVELLPATSVASYGGLGRPVPEIVILSDVIHHIPEAERHTFFQELKQALGGETTRLVVKEVEPGSPKARLLFLADRYISGDANVSFISRAGLRELVEDSFDVATCDETDLFKRDAPNYCLVFSLRGAGQAP